VPEGDEIGDELVDEDAVVDLEGSSMDPDGM